MGALEEFADKLQRYSADMKKLAQNLNEFVGGEPRRAVVSGTDEPKVPKASAEIPTPPIPDFGRPLGRAKTYTATIAWDPIGREWYGLCGLCKGDLGSISDADIGHYVPCDCCATDNFIERED